MIIGIFLLLKLIAFSTVFENSVNVTIALAPESLSCFEISSKNAQFYKNIFFITWTLYLLCIVDLELLALIRRIKRLKWRLDIRECLVKVMRSHHRVPILVFFGAPCWDFWTLNALHRKCISCRWCCIPIIIKKLILYVC